jgi:hypothetical protein
MVNSMHTAHVPTKCISPPITTISGKLPESLHLYVTLKCDSGEMNAKYINNCAKTELTKKRMEDVKRKTNSLSIRHNENNTTPTPLHNHS